MSDDPVQMLIREVDELLDESSVGLYEFLWILNGAEVPGSQSAHRRYARQALEALLTNEGGRLFFLLWAHPEYRVVMDRDLEDHDFDDPQPDRPYVALRRD